MNYCLLSIANFLFESVCACGKSPIIKFKSSEGLLFWLLTFSNCLVFLVSLLRIADQIIMEKHRAHAGSVRMDPSTSTAQSFCDFLNASLENIEIFTIVVYSERLSVDSCHAWEGFDCWWLSLLKYVTMCLLKDKLPSKRVQEDLSVCSGSCEHMCTCVLCSCPACSGGFKWLAVMSHNDEPVFQIMPGGLVKVLRNRNLDWLEGYCNLRAASVTSVNLK